MAEKKTYDPKLIKIGKFLEEKRKSLGKQYSSRAKFIEQRSQELFDGKEWISERHLANIELGKNWLSIEKLITHAYALEVEPKTFFDEIFNIYIEN